MIMGQNEILNRNMSILVGASTYLWSLLKMCSYHQYVYFLIFSDKLHQSVQIIHNYTHMPLIEIQLVLYFLQCAILLPLLSGHDHHLPSVLCLPHFICWQPKITSLCALSNVSSQTHSWKKKCELLLYVQNITCESHARNPWLQHHLLMVCGRKMRKSPSLTV